MRYRYSWALRERRRIFESSTADSEDTVYGERRTNKGTVVSTMKLWERT
jgi:hypothetical protein